MRRILAPVRIVCHHIVHQAVTAGRTRKAARPLLVPAGRTTVRIVRIAAVDIVDRVLVVVIIAVGCVRFLVRRL